MAGEQDWICAVEESREIARRIPSAELHVFPDAAHSIADDQTEEFLKTVRRFLDPVTSQEHA
jgi:pimeloyl-ACP methyl ester carboxylesterase